MELKIEDTSYGTLTVRNSAEGTSYQMEIRGAPSRDGLQVRALGAWKGKDLNRQVSWTGGVPEDLVLALADAESGPVALDLKAQIKAGGATYEARLRGSFALVSERRGTVRITLSNGTVIEGDLGAMQGSTGGGSARGIFGKLMGLLATAAVAIVGTILLGAFLSGAALLLSVAGLWGLAGTAQGVIVTGDSGGEPGSGPAGTGGGVDLRPCPGVNPD